MTWGEFQSGPGLVKPPQPQRSTKPGVREENFSQQPPLKTKPQEQWERPSTDLQSLEELN